MDNFLQAEKRPSAAEWRHLAEELTHAVENYPEAFTDLDAEKVQAALRRLNQICDSNAVKLEGQMVEEEIERDRHQVQQTLHPFDSPAVGYAKFLNRREPDFLRRLRENATPTPSAPLVQAGLKPEIQAIVERCKARASQHA